MSDARALVADAIDRPIDQVPVTGTIETVPGWDSLGHMRIILALEARLGRPLDANDILGLTSISAIQDVLGGS
ncbi:MAG: acyl carrier protein [Pseudomonadota bacterium]